jgi:hypothetical protein
MVPALAGADTPLSVPGGPPICPHILGWPEDVLNWANGAPWIKALDATSVAIAKERGARVLYRVWDHASGPDGDADIGGKLFGEEILERLSHLPKEKWPDAIGFQNEFNNVSEQGAQTFIDMYGVLREGGYEGLIVFGSYGPGGPTDPTEWERPHIRAACMKADAIETHEYWDLTVAHLDTWLAHRHVRAMNDYPWLRSKPWFIGEFGSDGVTPSEDPQKRSGWRDRDKLTADEYIRQIEIYRHGDEANGVVPCAENVLAVFLYQQGAPEYAWGKWETRGTPVMDYMKSTWTPTVGQISGTVKDATGNTVEGARVSLDASEKTALTDEQGRYWLFALQPGSYAISVEKEGYRSDQSTVSLTAGDILKNDVVLGKDQ